MTAALLTAINQPLDFHDIQPCALQYGQVEVEMIASGICGAQLQEIRGEKGTHFPRLIGHEGVGIVRDIGPGVKTISIGDRCCVHWRKGDGIESESPKYIVNDKVITGGQCVSFTEVAVCSENRVTRVPDDAPDDLVALLGCGLSTGIGTIENEANLKMGESVLVIGCGGLGLNLILASRLRRTGRICGVDRVSRFDTVTKLGAEFDCGKMPEGKFDVVIDTSGDGEAISQGLEKLAPSGRFIMVGQPVNHVTIQNAKHMFEGEGKTIKATQGGQFRPHIDIPRYVALWRSGGLDLDGIISHRLPFSEINQGIELVKAGEAGRVLIQML